MRDEWYGFVSKCLGIPVEKIHPNGLLCSCHFEKLAFKPPSKKNLLRLLEDNAIPTIFIVRAKHVNKSSIKPFVLIN